MTHQSERLPETRHEVVMKTLTRPIALPEPPAEGDWDLPADEAGDEE